MTDGENTAMHGTASLTDTSPTDSRIIAHIDCDCFYASCEQYRRPLLADQPVVVGMGYTHGATTGAVATASYEAREHGITSAMPIDEAIEHLPPTDEVPAPDVTSWSNTPATEQPTPPTHAYYCPVDMEYYEAIAETVMSVINEYADVVESVSVDESYIDISDATTWDTVEQYVTTLKTEIESTAGVPVSAGVAPTKSAAKAASDADKPDGLVIIEPGNVQQFFTDLPVIDIHGIGPVAAETLETMGITTGGELATTNPQRLKDKLGVQGVEVHQRARGHDPRDVTPADDPKSISNESSLGDATTDTDRQYTVASELLDSVHDRVEANKVLYQTVGVKVVEPPFDVSTRERSLVGPVADQDVATNIVMELLKEFDDASIRKLGVRVSNLSHTETKQRELGDWEQTDADLGTATPSFTALESGQSDNTIENNQSTLGDF